MRNYVTIKSRQVQAEEFGRNIGQRQELNEWVASLNPQFFCVLQVPVGTSDRAITGLLLRFKQHVCSRLRITDRELVKIFTFYETGPLRGLEHVNLIVRVPKKKVVRFKMRAMDIFRMALYFQRRRSKISKRGKWDLRIDEMRYTNRAIRYSTKMISAPINWSRWDVI